MARVDDLDPNGTRLPIKIDRTSNGEYAPPLLTPNQKLANKLAHEAASENARRLGLSRRAFLVSVPHHFQRLLGILCRLGKRHLGHAGARSPERP